MELFRQLILQKSFIEYVRVVNTPLKLLVNVFVVIALCDGGWTFHDSNAILLEELPIKL